MSNKKKGDDAEKFVASILQGFGYIAEIHPRTFKLIHLKNGKVIQVSKENDFHGSFDIKAERFDHMIYAQVKFMGENTKTRDEKRNIDRLYSFQFEYQRIQIWYVWKEWVKTPRRHKEYKFRIIERVGFNEKRKGSYHTFEGDWKEIYPSNGTDPFTKKIYQTMTSNYTLEQTPPSQIVSKLELNINNSPGKPIKEVKNE